MQNEFASAKMVSETHMSLEVDGATWLVHIEDWDWALAKQPEDRRWEEQARDILQLLQHGGRRIAPALAL